MRGNVLTVCNKVRELENGLRSLLLLFPGRLRDKYDRVLVNRGCKFQGQLIARKRSFVALPFIFYSQNKEYIWNKATRKLSRWTFSNTEKGVFRKNNACYLKCWQLFFTTVMPNQVVYYQQGGGKVNSDQQIAASEWHCPWPGPFYWKSEPSVVKIQQYCSFPVSAMLALRCAGLSWKGGTLVDFGNIGV